MTCGDQIRTNSSETHPACVVSLDDWLPKSIAQSLNSPAATDQPIAPRFFNVSMHQWRSSVRRMVRCKLAVALPGDTCPVWLSGGAFALPKDEDRDWLICDRRPQTSQGSSVNRVVILQRSHALGVHIVYKCNCFYLHEFDSSRWRTQVIGPRIPASPLHHIDDDTCDDNNNDDLESWWEPDLRQSPGNEEPHDGYRQIANIGVMTGDTNAVLEMSHRRQHTNAGVFRADALLLSERPLPLLNLAFFPTERA